MFPHSVLADINLTQYFHIFSNFYTEDEFYVIYIFAFNSSWREYPWSEFELSFHRECWVSPMFWLKFIASMEKLFIIPQNKNVERNFLFDGFSLFTSTKNFKQRTDYRILTDMNIKLLILWFIAQMPKIYERDIR